MVAWACCFGSVAAQDIMAGVEEAEEVAGSKELRARSKQQRASGIGGPADARSSTASPS
jgi:hypothetical protein